MKFLKSELKLQDELHFDNVLWHFKNYVFNNKRGS